MRKFASQAPLSLSSGRDIGYVDSHLLDVMSVQTMSQSGVTVVSM